MRAAPIAPQLIGHDLARYISHAFQELTKEALGGAFVPVLLHEDVQHIAILIDGSSGVMTIASDGDKHLIHEPGVAQTSLAASKTSREHPAELETPLADRLVADDYTPLRQQVLGVSEAEAKSVIEPNSVGNDLRRMAVARIGVPRRLHAAIIPSPLLPPSTLQCLP